MFLIGNKEFRLKVGSHVIGMKLPSSGYVKYFENYFGVKSSPEKYDILIKISFINHSEDIFVSDSMFVDKKTDGNGYIFGDNIAFGNYSTSICRGELKIKNGMIQVPIIRVFEQILYQAFNTIVKMKKSSDLLVHSSGVIYKGRGFLFVGSSGSGKSTTARLSEDYTVLNDEICLITKTGGSYYLNSTPFNGLYTEKKSGSASLAAIILLAHGKSNMFVEINKSDAVKILAKEIVPPVGLIDNLYPGLYAGLLDNASSLFDLVPVKKMEFLPDKSFWKLIDDEFFK